MHIQMVDATPLYFVLPKLVAEALNRDPKQTYRVLKCIYGQPDTRRAYHDAYSEHLTEDGYRRTASNPCLFYIADNE